MNRAGWIELRPRLRLRDEMATKFEALSAEEKSSLVTAGLEGNRLQPSMTLTPCEQQALGVAISMLRRGAAGGGTVGFRVEQAYLHQYSDLAETLDGLRSRLGAGA